MIFSKISFSQSILARLQAFSTLPFLQRLSFFHLFHLSSPWVPAGYHLSSTGRWAWNCLQPHFFPNGSQHNSFLFFKGLPTQLLVFFSKGLPTQLFAFFSKGSQHNSQPFFQRAPNTTLCLFSKGSQHNSLPFFQRAPHTTLTSFFGTSW